MNRRYVYADLPRTGLCNMLFPWARAVICARDEGRAMIAPNWVKLNRIGPLVRRERDKRYYFGQFTNVGYIAGVRKIWALLGMGDVKRISGIDDFFKSLKGESDFLRKEITRIVEPGIIQALADLPDRFIGVHIRRGDFARVGLSLSSDYYCSAIDRASSLVGGITPILVFSDAPEKELGYLHHYDRVVFMPRATAVYDMLALSKASVLIGTNESTFSMWAAFLGQMPTIWKGPGMPIKYEACCNEAVREFI